MLIALSLMTLLLTLLFSFMAQNMKAGKQMEKARFAILERQNLQIRLQDLFTSLSRGHSRSPLYTQTFPKEEQESVVFLYDNGIDPDPLFSGVLIGRLYLDEQQNFCLSSWPVDDAEERHWRKEILLSGVSRFAFQFLGEKKGNDPKIKPVTAHVGWYPYWKQEKTDLPSFIRLTIHQREKPLLFAFRLPTFEPVVTYWGKS